MAISGTLQRWAEDQEITLSYIQPGNPQQNIYVERDNRTVRHEWLKMKWLKSLNQSLHSHLRSAGRMGTMQKKASKDCTANNIS